MTNAEFSVRLCYLMREVMHQQTCLAEGMLDKEFHSDPAIGLKDFCKRVRDRIDDLEVETE